MAVTINRSAVVLRPRLPFVNWINSTDPKEQRFTFEEVADDNAVYLITEGTDSADPDEILRDAWSDIFEQELEGWYTDEALWPPNRSYRLFLEWFEVEVHTVVFDLSEEPLLTEGE
jgi:hypothetical protein